MSRFDKALDLVLAKLAGHREAASRATGTLRASRWVLQRLLDSRDRSSLAEVAPEPGRSEPAPPIERVETPDAPEALAAAPMDQMLPAAFIGAYEPVSDVAATKASRLDQVKRIALGCTRCPHLAQSRRSVVFGAGSIDAKVMFVGEAPGADEDAQGEPFVGRAGQLLTKIIQTMGYRREDVYIANVLKCRPDTPGQPSGNRAPTAQEMETCRRYLYEQIDIIQPEVLVTLGATAIRGLLGLAAPMGDLRGRWRAFRNIPVMSTYHPSYLLRNQSPLEKRKLWEDLLLVKERLGHSITERDRNYFLVKGNTSAQPGNE